MLRKTIKDSVLNSIKELQKEKALPVFDVPEIMIEMPENPEHGDYSTNAAMTLAKETKIAQKELAEIIKKKCEGKSIFEKIEIAEPGFINFFISETLLEKEVRDILSKKENYGKAEIGNGEKVNVEFISANPTGPLHVGNARGGFCGDVLANVLERAGYKPFREYYINNMGRQIEVLKDSLEGNDGYKNEYVDELMKAGIKDPQKGAGKIIEWIKETTSDMRIRYDRWFLESDLDKERKEVKKELDKKGLTEEKDGALWFKSDKLGDDKERVLERENGKATYILSDLAYLKNKFKRGFKKLIIFLGAEHHGYIGRIKAGAEALGYDKDKVIPVIMQLVRLMEDGKEVKMSKRTGTYVTIDELLKELKGKVGDDFGVDVARFFFLTRGYGNHLDFDLNLAKEQSNKNPVFYIQYAFARICSILDKAKNKPGGVSIKETAEKNLSKQLTRLPEIVEDTASDYQVQRLPRYAMDLAESFHKFYQECKVISDNKELTEKRLSLVLATRIVLKNALSLMGISAPEKM